MKVHTSETAVLVVFAVTLIGCILAGIPILAALALGYLIFFAYTLNRGYTVRDIFGMSWKGIKTAKNILITFSMLAKQGVTKVQSSLFRQMNLANSFKEVKEVPVWEPLKFLL